MEYKGRNEYLVNEMKIVEWYTSTLEEGTDAVTMRRNYRESCAKIAELQSELKRVKHDLNDKVKWQKDKLRETQAKLKQLFEEVYKPLMKEVTLKEKVIEK